VASFTLAVAPWARRQGAARALLAELKRWARRVGVAKLRLDVRGDNEPAMELYRSEGFVVEGVERAHIVDRGAYVDNRIMACFLEPELAAVAQSEERGGATATCGEGSTR